MASLEEDIATLRARNDATTAELVDMTAKAAKVFRFFSCFFVFPTTDPYLLSFVGWEQAESDLAAIQRRADVEGRVFQTTTVNEVMREKFERMGITELVVACRGRLGELYSCPSAPMPLYFVSHAPWQCDVGIGAD